jgi:tRNA/rRNA methyltransferase
MNLTQTDTSLFKRLRFVLMETSHPGNVGAVARAMKTMGFSELVLINPRYPDVLRHEEAIAFASGAQDILANARIVTHPQQALDDCQFVAAVSARLREFSPPVMAPRDFAAEAATQSDARMAIVFGSERYGLPNELVVNCNALINIPANPLYSSLNLAQAVQLLAYECRLVADALPAPAGNHGEIGFRGALASAQEREGMYAHLEQALIAIDFLDPASPKKLMPRLKRLFSRAELETEEVNIFRGIAKKILDFSVKG